jgi:hypothetical protein
MKKIYIILMILGAFFAACNPNKDIYESLDSKDVPYNESFDITLTDADYATLKTLIRKYAENEEDSTFGNEVGTYLSFSNKRLASKWIPYFLAQSFIALDSNSKINVTYNYAVSEYSSLTAYTITTTDFILMMLYDKEFTSVNTPAEFLPTFFEDKYGATQDSIIYVTAKYKNTDDTYVDSVMLYTRDAESWHYIENQYRLLAADYNSMGTPGANDYFTSSDPAKNYLPTFLKLKFPYSKAGDEKLIQYSYFTDYTQKLYEAYYFDGSEWTSSKPKTDQFIHTGTAWAFDPTVYYTMVKADYQIMVDYVANTPAIVAYLDPVYFANTEWYWGASAYYGNIDLRATKHRTYDPEGIYAVLSDEQLFELEMERLKEAAVIVAEAKFPNQQPLSNGIQVYYFINMKTYQPGYYYYDFKVKCVDVGQFEFEEGPIPTK